MEKELGLPKPGDLLIGVIDFFAVLVPGVIAAALIFQAVGRGLEQANTLLVGGLITAGWVLGHVLHGIGSWLDPLLYDRLFKPQDAVAPDAAEQRLAPGANRMRARIRKYFRKNDELFRLAKRMTDSPYGPTGDAAGAPVPGGMYQWARAWLNFHNPKATADLDRLEADSKLFRSLAVLFLILVPVLITAPTGTWGNSLAEHRTLLTILDVAGAVFSLWRYRDLRNKMIRQCYLNYVQLRFELRNDRERAISAGQRP